MQFSKFKLNPEWTKETIDEYEKIYKEIFEFDEYFLYGLNINPGDIVVDCGASIGLFARRAIAAKAKKVISFEPHRNIFKYLKMNTESNNKIIAVNGIVTHPNVQIIGEDFSDEVYDLDRIIKDFKLTKIDFLKLDIECAEYGFILNESDENLVKVDKWAIEFHACGQFAEKENEYKYIIWIMDRLSRLGYATTLAKLHPETCCFMMYAKK